MAKHIITPENQRALLKVILGLAAGSVVLALLPSHPPENWKQLSERPIGHWSSLLPTVLAILLTVYFRALIGALLAAVALGAVLAFGPSPADVVILGFKTFIWAKLADMFNIYILGFTTALFGMVMVMSRNGGAQGALLVLSRLANSARATRLATGAMGLAIFFDDYSNSMLIGATMRPVTDRWRISREKLAYLVDSTAAPVAGISLISTWIAYEVGLLQDIGTKLGLSANGYEIFLNLLPLRFYCLSALVFLFASAWMRRDFGPMYAAEERARLTGQVNAPGTKALSAGLDEDFQPPEGAPLRWPNALMPVGLVLILGLAGMIWTGRGALEEGRLALLSGPGIRAVLGAADSAKSLFWASIAGGLLAMALAVGQRILTPTQCLIAYGKGVLTVRVAVGILVLSWSMKAVCDTLGADTFLISVLAGRMPAELLPIATFVLASTIAFATGTSWGTMGILLPVALPLAQAVTGGGPEGSMILWLVGSAVLDGAIFGDHCSPISDTTVLSSVASGCDHIEHVRTQMPYALSAMAIAGVTGYLALPLGLPRMMTYLLIPACTIGLLLAVGKVVPEPER